MRILDAGSSLFGNRRGGVARDWTPRPCNPAVITDDNVHDIAPANATGRYFLSWLLDTNADATVGTLVTIHDDQGNTLARGYAAAGGGEWAIAFPIGSMPRTGLNAILQVTCATTNAEVYVSCGVCLSA